MPEHREIKKPQKLFAVAKDFNIGADTIVSFLKGKGFSDIQNNLNQRISGEMYDTLVKEYAADKPTNERANEVAERFKSTQKEIKQPLAPFKPKTIATTIPEPQNEKVKNRKIEIPILMSEKKTEPIEETNNKTTSQNNLRIAVFIDGNYFDICSNHYKEYHTKKSRFNLKGLIEYIREKVSEKTTTDLSRCLYVFSHYFKGRFSLSLIKEKYPNDQDRLLFFEKERATEDDLILTGIRQHPSLMRTNKEKGVDVSLANEATDPANIEKYDILALISGDKDFIPLVQRLKKSGKQVILICWEFEYKQTANSKQKAPTKASYDLMNECDYCIQVHKEIDDKDRKIKEKTNKIFEY